MNLIDKDKRELAKQLEERRKDEEFTKRLVERKEKDKHILHRLRKERPHTLGKDCWCQPRVEEVP